MTSTEGLFGEYQALGAAELRRRRDEISLLLEQDGVTYNVTDVEGRPHRPWAVDPFPLVIPTTEWQQIDRGVNQRAELLDLVLKDLYGERRLLRSGLIPPSMILSDPQFVRACDGITLPTSRQLIISGVELTRLANGDWISLGQRTQAPSGAAYALENRRVLSRVFPRLFRRAEVQRLAPFIRVLRTTLQAAAPKGIDDPFIVILSPGERSETAFEHASMAAQLGYPLVQGSDLEVRDGSVWLETVTGPVEVHVILRRVDAAFCDSLELRADSTLGVAGLVDACRTNKVSVVNTLGSGVLENAGLATVLPALSRHLLAEDLELPSLASWWCGDAASKSHVLAKLGTLIVRPLSRMSLEHSIDTSIASSAELENLRRRITARPEQWVGQERIQPGLEPVLGPDGFESRGTVLRAFAVALDDSYVTMRGGLARSASSDPHAPIANRAGAISKDTWVVGQELESELGFWLTSPEKPIRVTIEAPSGRSAENLFWLGRYAERTEATVRLLRAINDRRDQFDNAPLGPGPAAVAILLETLTNVTSTFPGFVGATTDVTLDDPNAELFAIVTDLHRPGSIAFDVDRMLDTVDALRDQLSVDTSLALASLQRELDQLEPNADDQDEAISAALTDLLQGLLSLAGLATESMVRDQGWYFMDAGRRIERALRATSLIGAALANERTAATESLLLESVLSTAESIITYRRRYRSRARPATVLDLLLHDPGNPRSLKFQLDRLHEDLSAILPGTTGGLGPRALALVAEADALLLAADTDALATPGEGGERIALAEFTAAVRTLLTQAADSIAAEYFSKRLPQHSVATPVDTPRART